MGFKYLWIGHCYTVSPVKIAQTRMAKAIQTLHLLPHEISILASVTPVKLHNQ